jgi:cytochrome c5
VAIARSSLFLLLLLLLAPAQAQKKPWAESPHGQMLERIIPPGFAPRMLPEPRTEGARLTQRYCTQCHNLANPAMHDAERWPSVIQRMVPRMEGKGNMGKLMAEMMAGVEAPSERETQVLMDYHVKHAQKALDPARVPDIQSPSAESFRLACGQCHVLPDPQRYTAKQWPPVVARMRRYMELTNRVVAAKPVPSEPQLTTEDINAFLIRHARK